VNLFNDDGLFGPTPFETQMTIMLHDDSAGSARGKNLAHFGRDWCVLGTPLTVAGTCNGLQPPGLRALDLRALDLRASDLRALASPSAQRSRAANDNQLAWPYLAFANDWYASC
jgi:hypothetical protein